MHTKLFALFAAMLVFGMAVAPAAAAVEADSAGNQISTSVTQSYDVTVTVTDNGTAVENATVNVSTVDESVTYDGFGSYETDENGTVALPTPEDDIEVELNVSANGSYTRTVLLRNDIEATLDGDEPPVVSVTRNGTVLEDANVTVSVNGSGSYDGTGEYTTGADGQVELETPEENVTVDVVAEADGARDEETFELTSTYQTDYESFGQAVSAFIHQELFDEMQSGGIGGELSSWVVKHNPGNAPSHAGPPAHAGQDNAGDGDDAGPSAAGNGQGPPEDRGPDKDDDVTTSEATEEDEEEEEADDEEGTEESEDEEETDESEDEEETDESEDEEETEDDEEEEEVDDEEETEDDDTNTEESEDDDSGGPPDHANGNAKGR